MNIKFYTDVHISHEAVRQLSDKGVFIIHCGDEGMSDASDEAHMEFATKHGYVIVTCDEDFERYHVEWQLSGREHSGIVYFRMLDQCQSISIVVKEILFLHSAADYQQDLHNQIWRAQG